MLCSGLRAVAGGDDRAWAPALGSPQFPEGRASLPLGEGGRGVHFLQGWQCARRAFPDRPCVGPISPIAPSPQEVGPPMPATYSGR